MPPKLGPRGSREGDTGYHRAHRGNQLGALSQVAYTYAWVDRMAWASVAS
jgi:hypothetical protein